MQRTLVQTWCDVDTSDEGRRQTFMIRGVTYEIDLCDAHLAELDELMTPFVESGRRIGGRRNGGKAKATPEQAAPATPAGGYGNASNDLDKDARSKVRAWARASGYEIGERGRISQDIYNAYQEAHS